MNEHSVYDKADYQMTGGRGGAPSWEHASAPPLFLIRWAMDCNLLNSGFVEENATSFTDYRQGTLTLFQVYEKTCDLVFDSEMLSNEGNAFARDYFDYDRGLFIKDLWAALKLGKYDHPLYTNEAYLIFKPVIDSRYAKWKSGDVVSVRALPEKPWTKRLKIVLGFLTVICMFVLAYLFILALNWLLSPRS